MNRILSFAVLAFFILYGSGGHAQLLSGGMGRADSTLPRGEFGLRAGTQMQSISGDTWENSYNTGLSGGFWARIHKNKIGVRVDVLVSTFRLNSSAVDSGGNKQYIISDSAGRQGSFRGTYLDVPLVLEISVLPKVLVQAGIQYSNLLSMANLNGIAGNYKTLFKQGEFSGLIGLEVKLPLGFSLGARYKYGFSDLNNKEVSLLTDSWKTNAIQLFACYKIK